MRPVCWGFCSHFLYKKQVILGGGGGEGFAPHDTILVDATSMVNNGFYISCFLGLNMAIVFFNKLFWFESLKMGMV